MKTINLSRLPLSSLSYKSSYYMINWYILAQKSTCQIPFKELLHVRIEPLNLRHDVTKSDIIIPYDHFFALTLILVFGPYFLYCTWLECISSYIKDSSC